MGTVIQDAELQAGFQIQVRWYVSASQRYPADENEYYSTFFQTLEPNQEFVLTDPRFDLANVNDPDDELEYIIRDICYVQTLVPQTVAFDYTWPGYIRRTSLTEAGEIGQTTITVDSAADLDAGALIILGPIQSDQYEVATRDLANNTLTLATPLIKDFPTGTDVNENAGAADGNYPDSNSADSIARVLDNSGSMAAVTEVTTPLFYDTSESVLRYYYTSALNTPFNGARGAGEQTNRPPVNYLGQSVIGRWWAIGDTDERAADRACLIDNQGFVIACRERGFEFDLMLSYSATSESGACTSQAFMPYFANHANFAAHRAPGDNEGTTRIQNPDGSNPPAGYYAWQSTIAGMTNERFVRFWDGQRFLPGIVTQSSPTVSGQVDNCPMPLVNMVTATRYSTQINGQCELNPIDTISLYYEPIGPTTFTVNNVRAIYTNEFGPNADMPARLNTTYLRVQGQTGLFLWNGTTLASVDATCPGAGYCGDPSALNTGSASLPNDFRNDALCEYPTYVCTDPFASNFQPANPPRIVGGGTCTYGQFTASYTVTNNIVGPAAGYTITSTTDTQDNGEMYNIMSNVRLNNGFRWVTQPNPAEFTNSARFNGQSVMIPITYRGEVATSAMPGCNTQGALNYDADSDGSQDCFFSIGTFSSGGSDANACGTAMGGTRNITLVRSDGDNNIREYDTATNMRIQGANGWYSDGTNFFQYNNGQQISTGTCPVPNPVTNFRFTMPPGPVEEIPGRVDVALAWDGTSTSGFVIDLDSGTTGTISMTGFGVRAGQNTFSGGFNASNLTPGSNLTFIATIRENTGTDLVPVGGRVLGRVTATYDLVNRVSVPTFTGDTTVNRGQTGNIGVDWTGGQGPFMIEATGGSVATLGISLGGVPNASATIPSTPNRTAILLFSPRQRVTRRITVRITDLSTGTSQAASISLSGR